MYILQQTQSTLNKCKIDDWTWAVGMDELKTPCIISSGILFPFGCYIGEHGIATEECYYANHE